MGPSLFRPRPLDTLKDCFRREFAAGLIAGSAVGIGMLPLAMVFDIAPGAIIAGVACPRLMQTSAFASAECDTN